MGFLGTLIVGLIAGLLASWIMKAKTGVFVDLILGVVGAFVGRIDRLVDHRCWSIRRYQPLQHHYRAHWFDHRYICLSTDQAQITNIEKNRVGLSARYDILNHPKKEKEILFLG